MRSEPVKILLLSIQWVFSKRANSFPFIPCLTLPPLRPPKSPLLHCWVSCRSKCLLCFPCEHWPSGLMGWLPPSPDSPITGVMTRSRAPQALATECFRGGTTAQIWPIIVMQGLEPELSGNTHPLFSLRLIRKCESKINLELSCPELAIFATSRKELKQEWINVGDFPGGAVVKTPQSQCRGPGFDPWSGN